MLSLPQCCLCLSGNLRNLAIILNKKLILSTTFVNVILPVHKLLMIPYNVQSKHQFWSQTLKMSYKFDFLCLSISFFNYCFSRQCFFFLLILYKCIFLLMCHWSCTNYLHIISFLYFPMIKLLSFLLLRLAILFLLPGSFSLNANKSLNIFTTHLMLSIITTVIFIIKIIFIEH